MIKKIILTVTISFFTLLSSCVKINTLYENYEQLEEKVLILEGEISQLTSALNSTTQALETATANYNNLQSSSDIQVSQLLSLIANLQDEKDSLEDELNIVKSSLVQLQIDVTGITGENNSLLETISSLTAQIEALEQASQTNNQNNFELIKSIISGQEKILLYRSGNFIIEKNFFESKKYENSTGGLTVKKIFNGQEVIGNIITIDNVELPDGFNKNNLSISSSFSSLSGNGNTLGLYFDSQLNDYKFYAIYKLEDDKWKFKLHFDFDFRNQQIIGFTPKGNGLIIFNKANYKLNYYQILNNSEITLIEDYQMSYLVDWNRFSLSDSFSKIIFAVNDNSKLKFKSLDINLENNNNIFSNENVLFSGSFPDWTLAPNKNIAISNSSLASDGKVFTISIYGITSTYPQTEINQGVLIFKNINGEWLRTKNIVLEENTKIGASERPISFLNEDGTKMICFQRRPVRTNSLGESIFFGYKALVFDIEEEITSLGGYDYSQYNEIIFPRFGENFRNSKIVFNAGGFQHIITIN